MFSQLIDIFIEFVMNQKQNSGHSSNEQNKKGQNAKQSNINDNKQNKNRSTTSNQQKKEPSDKTKGVPKSDDKKESSDKTKGVPKSDEKKESSDKTKGVPKSDEKKESSDKSKGVPKSDEKKESSDKTKGVPKSDEKKESSDKTKGVPKSDEKKESSDKTKGVSKIDPKTKKMIAKSDPKKEKSDKTKKKQKKSPKNPKTEVVKHNLQKTDKKTLSPFTEIELSVEKIKKLENSGYKQFKSIGKGSYGQVFIAKSAKHKKEVALKVVDMKRLTDAFLKKYTMVEIELMKKMDAHKNVVQFYEVIEATDDHLLYISMEYCPNGDLFDYIIRRHYIPERESCLWFKQLMSGVQHIHKSGYAHRDLKCENLLLDHNYNIKIVDFGFCCKIHYLKTAANVNQKVVNTFDNEIPSNTYCGSIIYASPELLRGLPYSPSKTDIWSCGIILYVILFGCYPNDGTELERFIQMSEHCIEAPDSPPVSEECKQLVKNILVDEQKRYSIVDIQTSDWFKKEWPSIDSTTNTKEYYENLNIQRVETLEFEYTTDNTVQNLKSDDNSGLKTLTTSMDSTQSGSDQS